MAKHSPSLRLLKLADHIEASKFWWSPAFAIQPDQTTPRILPVHLIIDDIDAWLSQDEITRYATEPTGSDYFVRAWHNPEEFNKVRSFFEQIARDGFADTLAPALMQNQVDKAKHGVAQAEHYLDCFRHALRYQHECAQAARAYAQTRGKEHHKESIAFDSPNPKSFEEALDLHLVDIGKYDPLLKHHIHAACHNAVHLKGTTPTDVAEATFDAVNCDRYFAKLEGRLRNNINTLGDIIKTLSRYRERIDEASHAAPQRQE